MLYRLLELFTNEYEETQNELLLKEIDKTLCLIESRQEKPKDHHLIVHIMNDQVYNHNKIMMIKNSTQCKDTHIFLIPNIQHKYLKLEEYEGLNVIIFSIKTQNNRFLLDAYILEILENADLVLIQYLYYHYISIFNQINFKGTLAWMPWGGDFLGYYMNEFFDELDISYLRKNDVLIDNQARTWHKEYKDIFDIFIKKVSILFVNKISFDILYQNNKNLIFFDYLFPQSEKYIEMTTIKSSYLDQYKNLLDTKKDLIKVIVGNSNTPENNHISAIQKLKNIQEKSNQKFFLTIMLSYGGDEKYKNAVKSICEMYFRNNYFIFEDFLDFSDLYNLINMQDIAYMNHIRSQGFGLINICLMLNINVYMRKNNISYKIYKEFEKNTNMSFNNLYVIEDIDDTIGFLLDEDKDIKKASNSLQILKQSFEYSETRFKKLFFGN